MEELGPSAERPLLTFLAGFFCPGPMPRTPHAQCCPEAGGHVQVACMNGTVRLVQARSPKLGTAGW